MAGGNRSTTFWTPAEILRAVLSIDQMPSETDIWFFERRERTQFQTNPEIRVVIRFIGVPFLTRWQLCRKLKALAHQIWSAGCGYSPYLEKNKIYFHSSKDGHELVFSFLTTSFPVMEVRKWKYITQSFQESGRVFSLTSIDVEGIRDEDDNLPAASA